MTQRTDVYTTIGRACGCCGHRHRSVREAGRCLAKYRCRELSDRRVVAVAADAPWPPAEGRDLNDAELDALYAEAGFPAASRTSTRDSPSSPPESRPTWRRYVASRTQLHNAWAEGGLGRDTKEDAEIAAAGCRVMGLALATVERAADSPCTRSTTVLLTRRASLSEATAVHFRWHEPCSKVSPICLATRQSPSSPTPTGPGRPRTLGALILTVLQLRGRAGWVHPGRKSPSIAARKLLGFLLTLRNNPPVD